MSPPPAYPVLDLSDTPLPRLLDLCTVLVGVQGRLLHGSCLAQAPPQLEARRAHDHHRAVGNLCAVYATRVPQVALLLATLNRPDLLRRLRSYSFGYRWDGAELSGRASPALQDLIQAKDPQLFAPGLVFVLPAEGFVEASPGEYLSARPIRPVAALRIGAAIGTHLLPRERVAAACESDG